MSLTENLNSLATDLEQGLGRELSLEGLEELRVEFLGRKGKLAEIMSALPRVDPAERPAIGKLANEVKNRLQELFEAKKNALEAEAQAGALKGFDPTVPGRTPWVGSLHPVTLVMDEICQIFRGLGYDIAVGPEVETDYYNFEALNIGPDHPARDMHDTLYISENVVLRTHTSPMQIRTMLKARPPISVIAPGKVYRRDSDLTHTPMFNQIEGILVDKKVSMGDLRGTLQAFSRRIFGDDTKIRFRPSFFPFTEPSAEVDISCMFCKGRGEMPDGGVCRVCKGTGWLEVLGCGMVAPEVFQSVGYDPGEWTGFAFGMGVERIAMLKYGITDLRMFFENDLRFLKQIA